MKFDSGIIVPDDRKGLLFDLDGTIVNNMPLHREAWVQLGQEYGVPITGQMIDEIAGIPTFQVIELFNQQFGWGIEPHAFTKKKQERYRDLKAAAGKTEVIQPIMDIIEYYRGKIPMTVGTGSSRDNALLALNDVGILDYFEIVVTADDVTNPKPHPEPFLKGAAHIGVAPQDCLVFEDGEMGMKSAIDGGIPYIDIRPFV